MNSISEISETSAFKIEKYHSTCANCTQIIQISLAVIIAIGITIALLAHFNYLQPAFIYVGSSISAASLLALGILPFCQKNNLEAAIEDVRSFKDLKAVLEGMEVGTSRDCANCLGADYSLRITSNSFYGDISSTKLNRKFEEMLKGPQVPFDEQEQQAARQIATFIAAKYGTVDSNHCGYIPNVSKYIHNKGD